MENADHEEADGRLATFAIVERPTPTSPRLLGTGFYLQYKGGFATAPHSFEQGIGCRIDERDGLGRQNRANGLPFDPKGIVFISCRPAFPDVGDHELGAHACAVARCGKAGAAY
jgi:hypothetical protein